MKLNFLSPPRGQRTIGCYEYGARLVGASSHEAPPLTGRVKENIEPCPTLDWTQIFPVVGQVRDVCLLVLKSSGAMDLA
jgi:hypothetical protein